MNKLYNMNNNGTNEELTLDLLSTLDDSTPIFLCVGTKNSLIDSVGVRVADILKNRYSVGAYVYGGSDSIVDASNIMDYVAYIRKFHSGKIYVIDSSLCSSPKSIGECRFRVGRSFTTLGKNKCGDYSIECFVGTISPHLSIIVPLHLKIMITNIADKIAYAIYSAVTLQNNFLTLGLKNVKLENKKIAY